MTWITVWHWCSGFSERRLLQFAEDLQPAIGPAGPHHFGQPTIFPVIGIDCPARLFA